MATLRAVLDTSVFIAGEHARPLGALPDEVAVSVITLSELRHGVLAATDDAQRARRLATLEVALRVGAPLAVDDAVGAELARLRVALSALGLSMRLMDALIAATAICAGAAVCTPDADFDAAAATGLLSVMRV